MKMEKSSEGKESAWNMAKAYLMRLDEILQRMNYYASSNDNYSWYMECMGLFRELSPKLDTESYSNIEEKIATIRGKLNQINILSQSTHKSAQYGSLYTDLHHLDITLRKSMEKLKLISPSKGDPGAAIEEQ